MEYYYSSHNKVYGSNDDQLNVLIDYKGVPELNDIIYIVKNFNNLAEYQRIFYLITEITEDTIYGKRVFLFVDEIDNFENKQIYKLSYVFFHHDKDLYGFKYDTHNIIKDKFQNKIKKKYIYI
jgi:hypothetical protein